ITAGAGASDQKKTSYPPVLAQLLGEGYEVKNFGIGGRTLLKNGDRPYWEEKKFHDSQAYEPDIVVIKLGTNDTKPMNWDAHGIELEGDLREMLTLYQNLPSRPKVYVCYPIWVVNDNMTIRESILVEYVIPTIYKVASELNVSIIDLHTTLYGMPQLIPDGVHPNDLGYTLIAKTIYDRIK
ncbi:MAG: GDSL-type esterase/lipase family protein, partial [Rikenellaceae bacterium]|nr:GDSL-type esterase/lipase family protein [Rikenellaceae bacterium]